MTRLSLVPISAGKVAVPPGNVLNANYALPRDAEAFDFNLTVPRPTGAGVVTARSKARSQPSCAAHMPRSWIEPGAYYML